MHEFTFVNWGWCGSGNVVRSKSESAACAIPPARVARPAFCGPPGGRGRDVAGARWHFCPRAPWGAAFRPPAAASGVLRFDECGGLRLGFDSCALRALWGPLRAPFALNYVKLRSDWNQ